MPPIPPADASRWREASQQLMVPAASWRTHLNQALTSASGHRRYHAGPGDCRRSAQPSASSLASLPHSNAGPWCVVCQTACLRCSPTFPIPTSSRACTPKVSALLLLREAHCPCACLDACVGGGGHTA